MMQPSARFRCSTRMSEILSLITLLGAVFLVGGSLSVLRHSVRTPGMPRRVIRPNPR